MPVSTPPPAVLVALALSAVTALALLVRLEPGGPVVARLVDDLAQAVAATAAAVCCGRRAHRSTRATAPTWWCYAAATGAWAIGQYAWTYHEAVARGPGRFPSLSDVCFLLFPLLGAAGLLRWPLADGRDPLRRRALLDGVLVAAALFVVAWSVSAGGPTGAGADLLASGAALVAPGADLVHLSLAVAVLSHTRRGRSGLGVLVAALVGLWATDWAFALLVTTGRNGTGSLVDLGWLATMLLVAAAAARTATDRPPRADEPPMASTGCALLPYAAATVGLAVALGDRLAGRDDRVTTAAAAVVVAALLVRQLLAVLDHRTLLRRVLAARDELEHRALHDPLTGLANRSLLDRRLREGLGHHRRDRRGLCLLYVDLDDFKEVNDDHGHEAGDLVLQQVAVRLREAVRSTDTVARLGGDEFAVLLVEADDPSEVAGRIATALAEPVLVGATRVSLGASIGSTIVTADEPTPTAQTLLRRADRAMYDVKRAVRRVAATASLG
ncbi:hypothetical protein GCM10009814_24790 [Lapillicoccus jejuensis]|uniref:Diguanylate cyclase (GGDEF)-like protein n=1 Tax=Lapillicoccus jejuensis TaxID=402171 RepID=A0A542E5Y7_9MICO|nr:diguanylate cyclase (GGDEF)-like protein [Lapillicoccus jejuensis]